MALQPFGDASARFAICKFICLYFSLIGLFYVAEKPYFCMISIRVCSQRDDSKYINKKLTFSSHIDFPHLHCRVSTLYGEIAVARGVHQFL